MNHHTKESLVAFEAHIRDLFAEGELPFLIHLSGGNEDQLIGVFQDIQPGDWIFSSHRSHYQYLLAGGSPERLEQLIRDGRSMFIFDRAKNFLTSSVLAGTCGIAAGVALAIKLDKGAGHVWCFLGDGAEDEGHFYEAAMFVEGSELPCTFVVEDNDRSVDTDISHRRGPHWKNAFEKFKCVRRYRYQPTWPHGGAGLKTMVTFKNPHPR
jgi:pyruvate dehydrogenase E1 component alpha subunit